MQAQHAADPSPPAEERAAPAAARPGQGRARSLGKHPLTAEELAERDELRVYLRIVDEERPRTRGDCASVPRPCPFVSCRHHLYLDETYGGAVKLLFPDREPGDLPAAMSCSLDVAERLGASLPEVGRALNVSMARASQIEEQALAKLKSHPAGPALLEALADVQAARDRLPAPEPAEDGIAGGEFLEALNRAAERYAPRMISPVVRRRRPLNK